MGGTQTDSRYAGGAPPAPSGTLNEGWNGTSWSEQTETGTNSAGRSGFGISGENFIAARGNSTANTELWNGTSWTELANQATGNVQSINGGGGTASLGIDITNGSPSVTLTEEWTTDNGVLTITTS